MIVIEAHHFVVVNLHLLAAGAQAQAARESQTKVEDPESPQGPDKGPATKRQHLIVMRHGERIDEVGRPCHCSICYDQVNMDHQTAAYTRVPKGSTSLSCCMAKE